MNFYLKFLRFFISSVQVRTIRRIEHGNFSFSFRQIKLLCVWILFIFSKVIVRTDQCINLDVSCNYKKMKKKIFLLILATLMINSYNSQEKKYSELKFVYSDLAEALKTKNDNVLKNFSYNIAPDQTTLEYMTKNNLCYRGIPCQLNSKNMDIKSIGDAFYPKFLEFRNRLDNDKLLENLEHVDSTIYKFDTDTITIYIDKKSKNPISKFEYTTLFMQHKNIDDYVEVKKYEIKGTEKEVVLKSGNKIINYHIGEMLFINNKWNLFTKPSIDYELIEQ